MTRDAKRSAWVASAVSRITSTQDRIARDAKRIGVRLGSKANFEIGLLPWGEGYPAAAWSDSDKRGCIGQRACCSPLLLVRKDLRSGAAAVAWRDSVSARRTGTSGTLFLLSEGEGRF